MEKLFLSGFLSYNKLYIVNQQHIHVPVFFPEGGDSCIISISDGFNQFVCKRFAGDINHLHIRLLGKNKMGNGVHQMGFSQSGSPVNKEGVVHLAR